MGENANDIDSADPPPPATWVPPMGASRLTWHNISEWLGLSSSVERLGQPLVQFGDGLVVLGWVGMLGNAEAEVAEAAQALAGHL